MNVLAKLGLLVLLLISSVTVSAQTQRIALPSGSHSIKSGTSKPLKAFCLDQHRAAPYEVSLNSVLGPSSGATVTRVADNITVSLAQALRNDWIEFQGNGAEKLILIAKGGGEYRLDIKESIALSEQPNEVSSDIADTLAWLDDNKSDISSMSLRDVWDHREADAATKLAEQVEYAKYFKSKEQLLELQTKVNETEGNVIAVAHAHVSDGVYDRLVLSPNAPIETFSGANADRELISRFRREGESLTILVSRLSELEQFRVLREALRGAYNHAKLQALAHSANKTALLLADADSVAGKGNLIIKNAIEPSAGGSGNGGGREGYDSLIMSNDDGLLIFKTQDEEELKVSPVARALLRAEDSQRTRIGVAKQGNHRWTNIVRGSATANVERVNIVFSHVYFTLRNAISWNRTTDEVVADVRQAAEFNKQAYEAFPLDGEVEVRLFLDDNERLNVKVATFQTENGVLYAVIGLDQETPAPISGS